MTVYKLIFVGLIIGVLTFVFEGNLINTLGIPSSQILSFFEQAGEWISTLASFGDLITTDGTILRMVRFGFYFGFFYVNYKFIKYLFSLFQ